MTTATKKPDITSDQPYREVQVYEGRRYEIESIETREFNEIEQRATKSEFDPITEQKREILDGQFQMELLMRRMIVEGLPKGGPARLPIRHYSNLRVRINELCFGVLPNEFKPANEEDKEEAEEDEGKGEG